MRESGITGVILAGGLGTRLDGEDKGLVEIDGRPMVAYVIERFAPQVDALAINANRNLDRYARFGFPVVRDMLADYPGPLAGIGTGLAHARTPLVACVPCDSPFLPADVVGRLAATLRRDGAEVCYAVSGGRPQPVFAVLAASLLESLTAYVEDGGRKIMGWYGTLNATELDFGDDNAPFANINTDTELAEAAQRIRTG